MVASRVWRLPFRINLVDENISLAGRVFFPTAPLTSFDNVPPLPSIDENNSAEFTQLYKDFEVGENSVAINAVKQSHPIGETQELPQLGSECPLAVLVHQYSKMGGQSELMAGIAVRLAGDHGIPALTFDMRGAGLSSGWCTINGAAEVRDVVAVAQWAKEALDAKSIFLLGSSAGAPIAGSAVPRIPYVRGYIAVGYVFGMFTWLIFGNHYQPILDSRKPKLFIHGDCDGFTSTKKFNQYFEKMNEPKEYLVVPNVGHFELEAPHYDDLVVETTLRFIRNCMSRSR